MLKRILNEFESASGGLSINELGHRISVERGALEGMIDYLVLKGKLQDDEKVQEVCSSGSCCPGPQGCPYVIKMPRTFSLTTQRRAQHCTTNSK